LAVAGGLFAAFSGTASATIPPVNVANSTVVCNSVTGKANFVPPITFSTSGTGLTNLITKIDGCSTPTAGISLAGGAMTVKGTLSSANANCTNLLGPSAVTTTIPLLLTWKVPPATAKPTPLTSSVSFTQVIGGTFAPGGTWGTASYGDFKVTTGASVVGAFTGGDGGASTSFEATTGTDVVPLAAACTSTVGLKTVTLGIGHINLG
jgi:hypothetical protein